MGVSVCVWLCMVSGAFGYVYGMCCEWNVCMDVSVITVSLVNTIISCVCASSVVSVVSDSLQPCGL